MGIFMREVAALYEAFAAGRPSPLAELPLQYADYAVRQRRSVQSGALKAGLEYWKRQLTGAPPAIGLPTDRPRPEVQGFHGGTHPFVLSKRETQALRELSRHHGTTTFMTLLAVWSVLLSRYSGQEDIVIGTPVANRDRPEIEGLIGFFVNMLAIRVDLSADPTFVELLMRVRETCLQGYTHQDAPFDQVVDALRPERDTSRTRFSRSLSFCRTCESYRGSTSNILRSDRIPLSLRFLSST